MINLLKSRILVKENEKVSTSGLIIIDSENETPKMGTIIKAGPGKWLDDDRFERTTVCEGMRIYFGKHCGVPVTLRGERYLVMDENDVIGILDP